MSEVDPSAPSASEIDASAQDPKEPAKDPTESDPKPSWKRAVISTLATTVAITIASYATPASFAATAVGMVFLAATYALVLRHSAVYIHAHGLSLGGLFEPTRLSVRRLAIAALKAIAIGAGLALVVAVPFALGYRFYYHPHHSLDLRALHTLPEDIAGQVLVIALPEEAFFRGYFQSEIDPWFKRRFRFLGASISPAIPIASLVFAVGHVLTRPDASRLAVFFPSLVFGFLRVRTGGVGASIVFHALCNLLASALAAAYHLHA